MKPVSAASAKVSKTYRDAAIDLYSRYQHMQTSVAEMTASSDPVGVRMLAGSAMAEAAEALLRGSRACMASSDKIMDSPCPSCGLAPETHCAGCGGCTWSLLDGLRRHPEEEHVSSECSVLMVGRAGV